MSKEKMSSREILMKRLQQEQSRSQYGRATIFKRGIDAPLFTPDNSSHTIDIVPYFAGPNDPWVEEGGETYTLSVPVHGNIGVVEGQKMCRELMYPEGCIQGPKKCPICKFRRKLQAEGASDEAIKRLQPKQYPRSLYNVICYDSHEQTRKGIQLFHTSFYLLQMYLLEMAKRAVRPGQKEVEPFIPFMDLKTGRSIIFKKEGKADTTKYIGIRFEDRDYELPDSYRDKAFKLDMMIDIPTEEEVEMYFFGDEEDRKTWTQGQGRRRPPTEEEGDGLEQPRRKPVDDDEPPPRRRPADDNECPHGYKYGDVDQHKVCEKCDDDEWTRCAKIAAAAKKAAAHKPPPDDDEPPPRKKPVDDDEPPPRRRRPADDDDEPPPRKKTADDDEPPPRRKPADDDEPPPRRRRPPDDDEPPPRKKPVDDDESPPRRKPVDDDEPPPRKKTADDDEPPPRRRRRPPEE